MHFAVVRVQTSVFVRHHANVNGAAECEYIVLICVNVRQPVLVRT